MKRHWYLVGFALLGGTLVACSDGGTDRTADTTQSAERGVWQAGGKADDGYVASCVGACGDQSTAGCWCDDICTAAGDCCPDQAAMCGAGCSSDSECPELACPLGGTAHALCVDAVCQAPTVNVCPNVECSDDSTCAQGQACVGWRCEAVEASCTTDADCPEVSCPLGGFAHAACVNGECVMPDVTTCPNVACGQDADCVAGQVCVGWECVASAAQCQDDSECPEVSCPLGGTAHAVCIDGACGTPEVTSCPGVECADNAACAANENCVDWKCASAGPMCENDSECPEFACPFGGVVHSICEKGACSGAPSVTSCPGVECDADQACLPNQACQNWKCVGS